MTTIIIKNHNLHYHVLKFNENPNLSANMADNIEFSKRTKIVEIFKVTGPKLYVVSNLNKAN